MTEGSRRLSSHAVQAAGRHLVAGEALLQGFTAEIQKGGRLGWVLINGLRAEVHVSTSDWPLTGNLIQPEADAAVFVRRGKQGRHEYFIAKRDVVMAALDADMEAQMREWGGRRPRNPDSDEQTLWAGIAEPWRDCWDIFAASR